MIDKDTFIKYMSKIKELAEHENTINNALRALDSDFGGFSFGEAIPLLVELVSTLTCDNDDWLSYYIWETEWGTNDLADSVTDRDGSKIPLRTLSDLYNVLSSEYKGENIAELKKYKLLYENEKDHTESLQRLVDRLGEYLAPEFYKKEIERYFNDTEPNMAKLLNVLCEFLGVDYND